MVKGPSAPTDDHRSEEEELLVADTRDPGDLGSGGNVDACVITAAGAKMLQP